MRFLVAQTPYRGRGLERRRLWPQPAPSTPRGHHSCPYTWLPAPPTRDLSFLKGSSFMLSTFLGPGMGGTRNPAMTKIVPPPRPWGSHSPEGAQTHPQTMMMTQNVGQGSPEGVLDPAWESGRASWRRRPHSWGRKESGQAQRRRIPDRGNSIRKTTELRRAQKVPKHISRCHPTL